MSSIQIAGDTSGSVTLAAPSIAGTTTLTLPATTGNVVTDSATQTLTNKTLTSPTITGLSASLPSGSVLQVVEASYKTAVTINTGVFTSTGVTASITPSSTSNKILVMVKLDIGSSAGGGAEGAQTRLYRNGSDIADARGDNSSNRIGSFITHPCFLDDSDSFITHYGQYLDSPSSTSSLEYRIYLKNLTSGGAYPIFLNRSNTDTDANYVPRGVCRITLMEIKG